MRKTVAARLRRARMLLELAKSRSDQIQIRWRSEDLGPWEGVDPQWSILEGKIRFQFHSRGRLLTFWATDIRQRAWGIHLFLADSVNPLPEPFEMIWEKQAFEPTGPRHVSQVVQYWLALKFPGHRIIRFSRRPDLARTLSGAFLRVLFVHRGECRLLIAADEASGDEVHQAIGQGLLWRSILVTAGKPKMSTKLYILVPSGMSGVLYHRCRFLNMDLINAEVWEYSGGDLNSPDVRKAPAPPPPQEDKDFRWPVLGPFRWSSPLQRVLDVAPELIRRYPRFHDYDSLRLWGLEFAQVQGTERDRVFFGVGPRRTELTKDNFDRIHALINEIVYYRRPDCPDTRHPYYRLQAERWLEALVLEDIARLFPEMAPESVYSQIPVYLGKDTGRIDILGADRQGTLVVMELKVAADPDLPLQALDYWGRVIQHNENGDFQRRGYFSEARLNRCHPRIYLVSPVFSFHDTTETLLRYLEPGLEVWKLSINEDWRCGVRIIRRIHYSCGEM